MVSLYKKLDEALQDLIEAYTELEDAVSEKAGDDEDAFSHAIIEALETSIESAIEEHDFSTSGFAAVLSNLTEALEQLDPVAFDDDSEEDEEEYEVEDEDYEIDEDDLDEGELDDEEEDEDDDY
ncbi:MAG TPA: hypothetical protein PKA63_03600 [Oligoflexia bacterium]|nr:hypothetical protein [Oligoflexia bacterium]HMP47739.1 hypothetical protein [Oligoflexia bacterium]